MKGVKLLLLAGFSSLLWTSCQRANARYIDLATGDTLMFEKDPGECQELVNTRTNKPVRLYVNERTKDTVLSSTGEIVNNRIRRTEDAYYVLANDDEYKVKIEGDGDYKIKRGDGADEYKLKVEEDGDYKEKWGDDYKVKRSGGEYKIKRGDYKKEVEKDGDVKIKNGNVKIKIDGETGERKVKVDD